MQERTLFERVRILEENVEGLSALPASLAAVELQIVQLRDENRVEFSATRAELRGEMQEMAATLRGEMRETAAALRVEIRDGDEETRRQMRVLHEDLVARLALIQEGQRPRRKR